MNIRNPAVEGGFYPADEKRLSDLIENFLSKKEQNIELKNKTIKALIEPHAGFIYSGGVASYGYNLVKNKNIKTIIILAPSHYVYFNYTSIGNYTHYKTPLGLVKISKSADKLKEESDLINTNNEAHIKEHSIEVQIPFLQKTLDDFEIIPIITGDLNKNQIEKIAKLIADNLDDETLIIASSDLSHFHSYEEAVKMDKQAINAIEKLDINNSANCEMCGKIPILILMNIAKKLNWTAKILKYANSGDITGDKDSVVGYSSIAFFVNDSSNENIERENDFLSKNQKQELLKIARKTIEEYILNNRKYEPKTNNEELKKPKGVFVTLQKNNQLRGCIGNILPTKALYLAVRDNAINAAVNDPRFDKLRTDELDKIEIEISVLTIPEEIKAKTQAEKIEKIKENIDGIILSSGFRKATFLPQVWEQLPKKQEFLSQLCLKAGLDSDCYLQEGVKIEKYQAIHFRS